jgi:uracil-DNA glycosylase family 4
VPASKSSPKKELRVLTRSLLARLEGGDIDAGLPKRASKAPSMATSGKASRMEALKQTVAACRKCALGSQRLQPVFGVGNPDAKVLFVGEGPGFKEDHVGEPFIGRAGQLLDKILLSIGLSRQSVYIANIVKCHPMVNPSDPESHGNDRPPTPEEIAACRPYLDEQIRLIAPKVIVTLGSVATKTLLGEDIPITKVRGMWREYRVPGEGMTIRLLPTFHPAALLRNPGLKRDVWTDMKNLKKVLEDRA